MDVIDNEADDTLEYSPKDTFIFNKEKSGKLTGEEIVTIPHPIIVVRLLFVSPNHGKAQSITQNQFCYFLLFSSSF